MSNIVAYYHIHLTDDPIVWSSIFLEQMKIVEDSGLSEQLDHINVTAITQDDDRVQMFLQLCRSYNIRMNIDLVKNTFDNDKQMLYSRDNDNSFTEEITLKKLWNDCNKEDMHVLYFHSKGSTSYANNMYSGGIPKHKQYYYWRAFMNWAHLRQWAFCENALQKYDIAGGDFRNEPSPHFCGNFWWATSNHIKQLPDPSDKSWWYKLKETTTDEWIKRAPKRMSDEMWIGAREGVKAYDIVNLKGIKPVTDCLTKLECERLLK